MTITIKENNYEAWAIERQRDILCNGRDSIVITVNGITYEDAAGCIILPPEYADYKIPGAIVMYRDGSAEIHIGRKNEAELTAEREQMITDLAEMLTDEQALGIVAAYPEWETGKAYSVSDRVRVGETLYKCITAHTAQSGWEPAAAPSLWARVSLDEWPEWVQPLGAHDAYGNGAKVTHSGEHWISTMESNIYEPGTYGWERS